MRPITFLKRFVEKILPAKQKEIPTRPAEKNETTLQVVPARENRFLRERCHCGRWGQKAIAKKSGRAIIVHRRRWEKPGGKGNFVPLEFHHLYQPF